MLEKKMNKTRSKHIIVINEDVYELMSEENYGFSNLLEIIAGVVLGFVVLSVAAIIWINVDDDWILSEETNSRVFTACIILLCVITLLSFYLFYAQCGPSARDEELQAGNITFNRAVDIITPKEPLLSKHDRPPSYKSIVESLSNLPPSYNGASDQASDLPKYEDIKVRIEKIYPYKEHHKATG